MINIYKNISLSNNNEEWGSAAIEFYRKIISDIVLEYEQLDYNPYDNKSVTIKHSPYDYPMCCSNEDPRVILLSTGDNFWCQLAYQFAHEYCHHLIDGPMDGETCSSFWFEESICELSSVYFMRRIAQKWIDKGTPILGQYAASVFRYCENNWSSTPFINTLSSWLSDNMGTISEPTYHRDMYKTIAKSLYPHFEEWPELWKLLPFLKRVYQDEYVNFEHWICNIVEPAIPEHLHDCFNILKGKILNK